MSQHVFSPDTDGQMSPAAWYAAAAQRDGFIADDAQANAIRYLQSLYEALLEFKRKRHRPFGKWLLTPDVPRGLYFWGGVGRGKSFLMDSFYACVPYKRKGRLHFHHFMHDVHAEMRTLKNEPDPLQTVAERIAKKYRLLCFDEFHVSDIADAMILGRLLTALFELGVVLVMTSNYEPEGLYPNGLQRHNFLPTIELLKANLTIINVDGGNDYRLRSLQRIETYLYPITQDTHGKLEFAFNEVANAADLKPEITIEGRKIKCIRHAPGVIWFDFMDICGGPRAQTDYLEIAREYNTVIVSDVPRLTEKDASAARRFTWLVDVFYDCRVKLILSAQVAPEALYTEGVQASEFFRTASRLQEMQTAEYLGLAHR
ncbi:cell division protein ZapE [Chitinivorax sp. B]|uniref:cell division protein ZapE n=1 Tax=Chitinivorax sp. B TaxID=2502235 RepID=UPI0020174CE7|nr:cell division protein ZapE [Chitinivorax sp. B]